MTNYYRRKTSVAFIIQKSFINIHQSYWQLDTRNCGDVVCVVSRKTKMKNLRGKKFPLYISSSTKDFSAVHVMEEAWCDSNWLPNLMIHCHNVYLHVFLHLKKFLWIFKIFIVERLDSAVHSRKAFFELSWLAHISSYTLLSTFVFLYSVILFLLLRYFVVVYV